MADDDRRPKVIAIGTAMLASAAVSVVIRMATRVWIILGVGLDDWLIVAALLMSGVQTLAMIMGTRYGLGRHVEVQEAWMNKPYHIALLVSSPSYSAAAALIKLSLLTFYLRLSQENYFRRFIYVMVFVTIGFGIGSITTVALQCIPLSMIWDSNANAALNLTTDFIIYAMPIQMLWKLRLPLVQRLGLCVVLSMGAIAVFASMYRISTLHLIFRSPDDTWNITSPIVWSCIELNIAIIASCVPAFKGCITHYLPRALGSFSSNSRSNIRMKNQTPRSSRNRKPFDTLTSVHHDETWGTSTNNTTTVVGQGRDEENLNESIEELVNTEGSDGIGGIVQTKDVWVEHETAVSGEDENPTDERNGSLEIERQ